ncbi:signal transduction histidine kinase [Kineothrix alysoides]|uniref:histidine kinase n=1 Tax=Kineothrix alysoides TaxID=1469948 RepID=A0A4R1QM32_9FIRM|nr:HAMP domain-containing sensor histidine kinase [Kineothrix alysoides]TCL54768.1 signal transduction histidine kinase [Kineothrix alysoides]
MKKKMVKIFIWFMLVLTAIALFSYINMPKPRLEGENGAYIVALNEIQQLSYAEDKQEEVNKKIHALQEELRDADFHENKMEVTKLIAVYAAAAGFVAFVFVYLYRKIVKPFEKLENFAYEIAGGNLDVSLDYERENYFGAFTWAFDHMRKEISKARNCEKEAIANNKTAIATLSHDIKTPIASIRTYAEALQSNMDNNPERRARYTSVIMKKCDEVTALTNDLFLHSLADMDKLKMHLEKEDIAEILEETITILTGGERTIFYENRGIHNKVLLDKKRFEQMIENLVNNAVKYAPDSRMEIVLEQEEQEAVISVRDFGQGIADEDMPFVFDKFYRGKNTEGKDGAGLGLYIVKYVAEQMDGSAVLVNKYPGIEVRIKFPLIE